MEETKPGRLRIVRDLLEIASFAAVVVGIVIGFADHFANREKEAHDARQALYDGLDAEYRDHVRFCAEHPRLDPRLHPPGIPAPPLSPEEQIQQRAMFTLLIDLFERAYLEFHDRDTEALIDEERRDQWAGWAHYIDSYAAIAPFRDAWSACAAEFDTGFQAWMAPRIAAAAGKR